jgi:large repetitive protein
MSIGKNIKLALLPTLAITTLLVSFVFTPFVNADGVDIDLTTDAVAVSSTGNITLDYTSTADVTTSGNIKVAFDTAYTGTPSFSINSAAATSTNATSGSTITYTLTPGATVSTGSVSIEIAGLTTPSTAGNYSFTVLTSTGDYGAVLQYVGDANVVNVTAQVLPILSFVIRNSADTANTNTCDLGNLQITQVSTCDYRLKVSTNSNSGYTVSVNTSGDLTSGSYDISNAASGPAGDDISTGTAGTEKYGVVVDPGTSTTSSVVDLASSFDAGSNAVSYANTSNATLLTSAGANSPATSADTTNTALVTHKANISTSTSAGFYTQTVTYTVVAAF